MDISLVITGLLFLTIWFVPVCSREFRNSAQLMLTYWFLIVLHQAVAITNAYWFVALSAEKDARSFHNFGMMIAQSENFTFSVGDSFYKNMLGVVYWIFGPSLMLAQQLSILAFSISCVVLVKILYQMELSRYRLSILLVFGALPTMVVLGSLSLRESYQIVFFMLAVYFGLKMHITRDVNRNLLFMIMSAVGMGVLHQALSVYALFLVVLFILWTHRPVSRLRNVKKLRLMAVLIIPVLILSISAYTNYTKTDTALSYFASGNMDLLDSAAQYRDKSPWTRATYGISLDLTSTFMTIYSCLMLYIHYLFAPFLWKINNALDVYASIESLLRLVLIYFALRNWRNASGTQRRLIALMLTLFFSMTFLWSIGTTNYGTSIRHHMLSWWILVIAGLPMLMETLNRALLGSPIRRH
jgi:hypothetical protein